MSHTLKRQERIGEFFILFEAVLDGLFPIIINYAVGLLPAVFFAAASNLVAAVVFFFYMLVKFPGKFLLSRELFWNIVGVTLFIVVVPQFFIYVGTGFTSGINTSLLLRSEVLFTFIICGLWYHEKITAQKIAGAIVITLGAILVLYNGAFSINKGDLLIILGTLFFPFGNICAKKALKLAGSLPILFYRSLFGGVLLLLLSFFIEGTFSGTTLGVIQGFGLIILLNGLLLNTLEKIVWYQGLQRIDITKAIPLSSCAPAFSLIFAILFLREIPTAYQLAGLALMPAGIFLITKKSRVLPVEP